MDVSGKTALVTGAARGIGKGCALELATINDETSCGDRSLDAINPPVAIDATDGEKRRRRKSNPCTHLSKTDVLERLTETSCGSSGN